MVVNIFHILCIYSLFSSFYFLERYMEKGIVPCMVSVDNVVTGRF